MRREKNKNLKENTMSYDEFDWMVMCNSGRLAKQCVCVLDKCIHKHNLLIQEREGHGYFWPSSGGGFNLISEPKFKIPPPPPPLLISEKSLSGSLKLVNQFQGCPSSPGNLSFFQVGKAANAPRWGRAFIQKPCDGA